MARDRSAPKGLNLVPKTLKSGARVHYGYFGRGAGAIALGRVGSAEYHERLAAALRRQPEDGTVAALIWAYKQSTDFAGLRDRTRKDYLRHLDRIQVHFGRLSLSRISSRAFIKPIYAWRDTMAHSPRQADYAVQVLKALLGWGERRGLIEANRAKGIPRLYKANRSDKSWTEDQVQAFLDTAPAPLKLALVLALETGQRQGDLLVLPWTAVKGDTIELRQSKTRKDVAVEISPILRPYLKEARAQTRSTTILTRDDGLPWDSKGNGFRAAWRDAAKAAGVSGVTFNDLRGTFITRRLAEGWSREDVAWVTGWSMRNLAMIDVYADRRKIAVERASQRANAGRGGEA